jgi:hypothetical protein
VNDRASIDSDVPLPTGTVEPMAIAKSVFRKPPAPMTAPARMRMRLRWAMTVPNGPQRKRSA